MVPKFQALFGFSFVVFSIVETDSFETFVENVSSFLEKKWKKEMEAMFLFFCFEKKKNGLCFLWDVV